VEVVAREKVDDDDDDGPVSLSQEKKPPLMCFGLHGHLLFFVIPHLSFFSMGFSNICVALAMAFGRLGFPFRE
jgi:hypothetical protein